MFFSLHSNLDPDAMNTIFTNGLQYSSSEVDWNIVRGRYRQAMDAHLQENLREALLASRNPQMLYRLVYLFPECVEK